MANLKNISTKVDHCASSNGRIQNGAQMRNSQSDTSDFALISKS